MNSRNFWAEMANTYLKFGAHQDAISAYTRQIESVSHPVEKADLWCKIGDIYLTLKNLPDAVSAYHNASMLDPDGHDFAAILDRIPQNGQYDQSVIHAVKQMLGLEVSTSLTEAEAVAEAPAPAAEETAATEAETVAEALAPAAEETAATEAETAAEALAPAAEATAATETETVAEAPAPAAEETAAVEEEAIATDPAPAAEETPVVVDHGLVDLPIADVLPDPCPLRADLAITELVESVREHGIIQPLIVTPDDASGKYVVIAGNRRLEAARQAGLQTVPAIIRSASPQQRIVWSLIENTQRSDLNALEQAEAFRSLLLHFNLDESQVGRLISHSEAHVRRMLGLLHLTDAVKQALLDRAISEEHAHALSRIDIPEMQNSVLAFVIENDLGVRQVEDLVRRLVGHQTSMSEAPAAVETVEAAVEQTEAPVDESAEPVAVETVETAVEQTEAPAVESAEPVAVETVEAVAEQSEALAVESAEPVAVETVETAVEQTEAPAVESAEPVAMETVETAVEQTEAPVTESTVPVAVEGAEADVFSPVVESVAAISFPVTSPEPALELAVQTQTAVETGVMVAEPMPVAQPDQAWEAALDEMVITPEAEPEAIREPDIEVMPVHDEHGVFDEARFKAYQGISLYERVTSDNPDNDRAWHTLGKYYSEVGQFDKAIEAINRAIAIDGTKDIYYYHLGQAYAAARRYLEAIRAFEQTVALNPQHVFAHCSLAGYYRKLGNDSEAIKHIEIALPNIRQEKAYNQACFEAICGNTDRAIELLKTSLRVDQVPLEWLRRDPDLDFIRDDARFQQLMSEHEALLALKSH